MNQLGYFFMYNLSVTGNMQCVFKACLFVQFLLLGFYFLNIFFNYPVVISVIVYGSFNGRKNCI